MLQRIRLLRIAAPPRNDRTRRQCRRFGRSIQLVELIQCGRRIVEASEADLDERHSEKGVFARRPAFRSVAKRRKRFFQPALPTSVNPRLFHAPDSSGLIFKVFSKASLASSRRLRASNTLPRC